MNIRQFANWQFNVATLFVSKQTVVVLAHSLENTARSLSRLYLAVSGASFSGHHVRMYQHLPVRSQAPACD